MRGYSTLVTQAKAPELYSSIFGNPMPPLVPVTAVVMATTATTPPVDVRPSNPPQLLLAHRPVFKVRESELPAPVHQVARPAQINATRTLVSSSSDTSPSIHQQPTDMATFDNVPPRKSSRFRHSGDSDNWNSDSTSNNNATTTITGDLGKSTFLPSTNHPSTTNNEGSTLSISTTSQQPYVMKPLSPNVDRNPLAFTTSSNRPTNYSTTAPAIRSTSVIHFAHRPVYTKPPTTQQ